MKKLLIIAFCVISSAITFAQQTPITKPDLLMDSLRPNGNRVIYQFAGKIDIILRDSSNARYLSLKNSEFVVHCQKRIIYADTTEDDRYVNVTVHIPFTNVRSIANSVITSSVMTKAIKKELLPNVPARIIDE